MLWRQHYSTFVYSEFLLIPLVYSDGFKNFVNSTRG